MKRSLLGGYIECQPGVVVLLLVMCLGGPFECRGLERLHH